MKQEIGVDLKKKLNHLKVKMMKKKFHLMNN